MRFNATGARLLCAAALLTVCAGALCAQEPYKVIDHWKLGGEGGWDYMTADPGAHLLYVTHGPRVEVIDTHTGKAVGAITGLQGTHGVVLDPDGKVGYVSDGRGDAVVVFDRKSFAVLARIPAGTNPDGITYEPVTKTVWAFNGRSQNVTVVSTATRSVVATIALPGKPEFPEADGKGHVFDNIESKNSIAELDARTDKLIATWPLTGCESPSGLAIDREHMRLFAVCDGGKMAVVDAKTGKQLASPEIGEGPDAARFDAKRQLAFSSNGGGTLTVIDAAHDYKVLETLPTQQGARTMAYDPREDHAFVVTAELGPRPAPTADHPRQRPAILPGSFTVLVIGRK